jgi:hypothetical protein
VLGSSFLVAGAIWLLTEPITGAHVMHLFGTHGVDTGDLLAIPLLVVGASLAWSG